MGGLAPEAFYALGDKAARSGHLQRILPDADLAIPIAPEVRQHWASATGWSFPSGHATSAFATFAFSAGLLLLRFGYRRAALPIAIWAIGVCYTRVLLHVHTPLDIAAGALQGAVFGLLALTLYRRFLGADAQHETDLEAR